MPGLAKLLQWPKKLVEICWSLGKNAALGGDFQGLGRHLLFGWNYGAELAGLSLAGSINGPQKRELLCGRQSAKVLMYVPCSFWYIALVVMWVIFETVIGTVAVMYMDNLWSCIYGSVRRNQEVQGLYYSIARPGN